VELLRNGKLHDRVVADKSGQFAMVPSRLPAGNYELTLRSRQPDGREVTSKDSVVVALQPSLKDRPVVALMRPDKPSVVLSKPVAPNSTGGAVAVETVETEPSGKLYVSGRSPPGAAVRLYLNDSYLASATAAADGRFTFTVNGGVRPGGYRVRLDEVDSGSGAIRSRAEVPFRVPGAVAANDSGLNQTVGSSQSSQPSQNPLQIAETQDGAAVPAADANSPAAVTVPKVATAVVSRGDSLWRISRAVYGAGERYTIIYGANHNQIRNPDRIYPGQIFVLPEKAR
jgi:nucleoid-associated protein YgaU